MQLEPPELNCHSRRTFSRNLILSLFYWPGLSAIVGAAIATVLEFTKMTAHDSYRTTKATSEANHSSRVLAAELTAEQARKAADLTYKVSGAVPAASYAAYDAAYKAAQSTRDATVASSIVTHVSEVKAAQVTLRSANEAASGYPLN